MLQTIADAFGFKIGLEIEILKCKIRRLLAKVLLWGKLNSFRDTIVKNKQNQKYNKQESQEWLGNIFINLSIYHSSERPLVFGIKLKPRKTNPPSNIE